MTPDLQIKVSQWRVKAINGTLTPEDMAQAVMVIREGRVGATAASAASTVKKAKAATPLPNGDDLLSEMMG